MTRTRLFVALLSIAAFVGLSVCRIDSAHAATAKKKADTTTTTSSSVNPKVDPNDPTSVLYLDTSGKPAGIGDPAVPASNAFKLGRGWHPQALVESNLPKDKFGLIDWAKAVRDNAVKPRFSLDPAVTQDDEPMDLDIVIETKSDFVNDVLYPHKIHTYWLKCEICHGTVGGAIFTPARGTNNMTMTGISQGQWCGRCHNKIAFPLADCKRCHSVPKATKAKK